MTLKKWYLQLLILFSHKIQLLKQKDMARQSEDSQKEKLCLGGE